ncbi:hypothetical protein B0T13DRAFT_280654 [Neurospora crassa]|nr:hypothetical protein B0T13DRAFT_280654 [Neurospora crassa]
MKQMTWPAGKRRSLPRHACLFYYGDMGKLNPWARSLNTQCSRSVGCGGLCEIPDREVKLLLATAVAAWRSRDVPLSPRTEASTPLLGPSS